MVLAEVFSFEKGLDRNLNDCPWFDIHESTASLKLRALVLVPNILGQVTQHTCGQPNHQTHIFYTCMHLMNVFA